MTLRVVHVASGREWRGGQNQVLLLARALQRTGLVRQTVVTGRGSELARRLAEAGVPVSDTGWDAALDPRALARTWREAAPAGTILHAHDAHALVLAGLARRRHGRLVVTRRVDFHLRRPGFWARADRVIAISEAVRRVLVADGIASERISVIHSGIDPAAVRGLPSAGLRGRLRLAPETPLVLNIAALVPHKDQGTLLAAAAALRESRPDVHWAVAGEGPLRPELEAAIIRLGLAGRVHLLGAVPGAAALLQEADVFVLSSREEGLGTSVLDAMACRIPVAATRAGGIPEMLEGGAGLLVPPGDGPALAQAVLSLITDPATRARVLAQADARLTAFTDNRMTERVLRVYRSLTATG